MLDGYAISSTIGCAIKFIIKYMQANMTIPPNNHAIAFDVPPVIFMILLCSDSLLRNVVRI